MLADRPSLWRRMWTRSAPRRLVDETPDVRLNAIIVIAYAAIGATLILQPSRYDLTPSYANLLNILPQAWWGSIYLLIAAGLAVAVRVRYVRAAVVVAYTVAVAFTGTWLAAFVVRWLSDSRTTIVNVVSWSVFLILLIMSAVTQIDRLAVAEHIDELHDALHDELHDDEQCETEHGDDQPGPT